MDEEKGIYRGEVTTMMGVLADINVNVTTILAYIKGEEDDEEEEEEDDPFADVEPEEGTAEDMRRRELLDEEPEREDEGEAAGAEEDELAVLDHGLPTAQHRAHRAPQSPPLVR